MGLDAAALELIAPHLDGAAVLCLSYPDIVIPADQVKAILGIEVEEFTDFGKHHKLIFPLPETRHVLARAGARTIEFMDVRPSRGVETVIDLNEEVNWERQYDLVIDPGTLEHCFNIGGAFRSAWKAVKLGGHIVHVHPLQMINHGFWNVCPTAICDFYAANGGEKRALKPLYRNGEFAAFSPTTRFRVDGEAVLYSKIQKVADVPFTWPAQTRYKVKAT